MHTGPHALATNACLLQRRGRDSNPRSRSPGTTVFKTAAFNRSATPPGSRTDRGRRLAGGPVAKAVERQAEDALGLVRIAGGDLGDPDHHLDDFGDGDVVAHDP